MVLIKNKLSNIGLNLPEEDEAMLLWYLSTAYLQFFYPDSHFFDAYLEFDNALPSKTKNRTLTRKLCPLHIVPRHVSSGPLQVTEHLSTPSPLHSPFAVRFY